MSDQINNINLFDVLEMLATNEASTLSIGEIDYQIVYGKDLQAEDVGYEKIHKISVKNEVDGHEVYAEAESTNVENALAGAINNYIKNILQELVGYGVVENDEENFVKKLESNGVKSQDSNNKSVNAIS